ncbi:alpha/beta hydrolase [Jatrophihabitans cynanchi]|jgi:acetyl esterase/lipase|uniref:Alpha/beta hydrolase n=1 Tax=Jatrophihabitans cynanchi TaxID=2944128 RepID=A0ABY7JU54_9ACTN|nr:alpha/beta hydrolase fold domain-containing protein [Jatrophihabitans sp. SB3-54]WAX55228.1 alpha/beta hydrolase [Jatrophihabitans sp. SB3-54]
MVHLPRPVVRALSAPAYRLGLAERRSVRAQRLITELSCRLNPAPSGTRVEHIVLGGRPAEATALGAGRSAVLYLHGGGYVVGSPRMYRTLAAHLSRAAAAVVYNLDYRLAPEHRFPAALEDTVAAFGDLVRHHGYQPGQIALAGDSAGGGLAVAAARVLTDEGMRPGALALLSPWTDPADQDLPERDFVVNVGWGRRCSELYLGQADPSDPGFAPLHGRLHGLPPMLVHYHAEEMLRAQIGRFIAAARAAGVDVREFESARVWHSGHVLAGLLRDATDEARSVGDFLRLQLTGGDRAAEHRAAGGTYRG